jgi:acyl dehydratase
MKIKEISIGQKTSRKMTVTKDMINKYAEITGDYNPIHFDLEFVKKTKFGRLVAQGGVTSGILNTIVAMDLPGPGTVFIHQEYDYKAPVYIDDTITGSVEVYEIHPTKPVTKILVKIVNQEGITVLEGNCVCYTFEV